MAKRGANENGFVVITMIAIIPLILLLASGTALWAIAIHQRTEVGAQCRKAVWKAQGEMSRQLTQLLALNPKVSALRQRQAMAARNLKLAKLSLNPKLIAAAKAQVLLILVQQNALRIQQERLLHQARFERANARQQTQRSLKKWQVQIQKRWSKTTSLAVEATPMNDPFPLYKTQFDFAPNQSLSLNWQMPLLANSPTWLRQTLGIHQTTIRGTCSATISRKEDLWRPRLFVAKSYSN